MQGSGPFTKQQPRAGSDPGDQLQEMPDSRLFGKKKPKKPRPDPTWDNVFGTAIQEYDCAWKCRKCGRLHIQHGTMTIRQLWRSATKSYGEKMIPILLEGQLRSINQGTLKPLDLPGVCEGCGHEQPWGQAACQKLLPKRSNGIQVLLEIGCVFAAMMVFFWVIIVGAFWTETSMPYALWLSLGLLGEAAWILAVVACVKGVKRIRAMRKNAAQQLLATEQAMKANHEEGCFPLLRTGNATDWFPQDRDERMNALEAQFGKYPPVFRV